MIAATLIGYGVWLVATDVPAHQFLIRVYGDKRFLKQTLHQWGLLAPIIFPLAFRLCRSSSLRFRGS